ncbi:Cu and Ag efflux protein CusF [Nitrosospira multiformis]|uniref:Cu and Ag efflux protein CusF n=1 Tax=Nitrosospira multiformis TaxID=1231 RepID=A0A1H8B146_9PROT|nr:copper-binding protein [Nitrosospira multiformis]SEM76476.1 Cu and Ag efflux protein CusF [Nitrosospira multiformis]
MITPLFVVLQLAPILACLSAEPLGGEAAQPAPIDSRQIALSMRYEPVLFNDGLFHKQNFEPAKDKKTIVASASGATKTTPPANLVPGRGIVVKIDRINALVRINHDPIPALDWPRMTMSFRLRESALAGQVKEGDVVEFFLEKSGSNYIIVKWRRQAPTGQGSSQ